MLANSLEFTVNLGFAIIHDLRPSFSSPYSPIAAPKVRRAFLFRNCSRSYTINGPSGSATFFAPTC